MSSAELSRFLELPKEIRLQAWRHAAEKALHPSRAIINGAGRDPAVLNFNDESREETLLRTNLKTFGKNRIASLRSTAHHYSMETDIFVITGLRMPYNFALDLRLRAAIQTLAIPASVLMCSDRDIQISRLMTWMSDYKGVKTIVILRDDPTQESVSHHRLIISPSDYSRTDDLRITVDAHPVSQENVNGMRFEARHITELVDFMQSVKLGWKFPVIKYGCLVRH